MGTDNFELNNYYGLAGSNIADNQTTSLLTANFTLEPAVGQVIDKLCGAKRYLAHSEIFAGDAFIKKVIFNNPATIVLWSDGTKTVVKCQEGDTFDPEHGLAMCIAKKCCGNRGCFNEVFKKWLPKEQS